MYCAFHHSPTRFFVLPITLIQQWVQVFVLLIEWRVQLIFALAIILLGNIFRAYHHSYATLLVLTIFPMMQFLCLPLFLLLHFLYLSLFKFYYVAFEKENCVFLLFCCIVSAYHFYTLNPNLFLVMLSLFYCYKMDLNWGVASIVRVRRISRLA